MNMTDTVAAGSLDGFGDFVPWIAAHLGLSGSTLMMLILIVMQGAKVVGRRIPNDATGFWGQLRMICVVLGADPSSVVTTSASGKPVTVQDVSTAALKTPPIADMPPVSDKQA